MDQSSTPREKIIGFLISFSLGAFLIEFLQGAYTAFGFFFYETEIKLSITLVSVTFSMFSLWKAIIDPILGYLLGKSSKVFQKWGKSFTWILLSILPWFACLLMFYNTPGWSVESQEGLIFLWLLFSMLAYGLFISIFSINYFGLIPVRFKEDAIRRSVQGYVGISSFLGMLLGALIPTFIISYGNIQSYGVMSLIIVGIAFIPAIGMIPGIYEPPNLRPKFKEARITQNESFWTMVKFSAKHKNYRILLLLSFTNQVIMSCVGGSLHYIVKYIYLEDIDISVFFYIGYFSGALIGSFAWVKIADKLQNTKLSYLLSGLCMLVCQIPMIFVKNYNYYIASILLFPFAFCFSGFWSTLRVPLSSDVLDELSADLGKRNDSTFIGIRSIFFQLAIVFQSLVFGVVHTITNFDKNVELQPVSAQNGIIFLFAAVPILLEIITFLIFWLRYDLTPERVQKVKHQL
ncbi:MAG: MFS transporter [Candidatus Lokiarchaeota archaeon]|nr:MFS transporter [Candidatus Lokiarchaeota archaeon]